MGVGAGCFPYKKINEERLLIERMTKPMKRHPKLQPFSREHHHSLLLCWKIRQGVKKKVEKQRIFNYLKWYYDHYLLDHMEAEELKLLPMLKENDSNFQRVLNDHHAIRKFIVQNNITLKSLETFALLLESHIRFEERVLFHEIQNAHMLEKINGKLRGHDGTQFKENEKDLFWK